MASASPRRSELLSSIGLGFTAFPVVVDETPRAGEKPVDFALRIAEEKASSITLSGNAVSIGCDTIVVQGSNIFGKPRDESEAAEMLGLLSGKSHLVITAVALKSQRLVSDYSTTEVHFAPLSERIIRWYLSTGEPMDKAGAYGIQGRAGLFVTRIYGSYSNVVGLPMHLLPGIFDRIGIDFYSLLQPD